MSNDNSSECLILSSRRIMGKAQTSHMIMLLFTAGIFLIALLTFIVLLIEKISKK